MRASSGSTVKTSSTILTAKRLKEIIKFNAASALHQFPDDADMRSRAFVALLSGSIGYHDEPLGQHLRGVYRSTAETIGTQA